MIAFVLSGAGNRGPVELGALRALVEAGLMPDFLVGTSAGAINSCYMAARGMSLEAIEEAARLWESAKAASVYPGGLLGAVWRVMRNENSLYPNTGIRKLIEDGLPAGVMRFQDLQLPLYVTAVDLLSHRLFVFGEDPNTPLVDTVMASATVPPVHPPVNYGDMQLVDGGVLANVAASFAIEKGATQLWVINAGYGGERMLPAQGVLDVIWRTISVMMAQMLLRDLDYATEDPAIDLHHIQISAFQDISFRDFSKTRAMIEAGYEAAKKYLAAPRPRIVAPAPTAEARAGATAPGARQFIPPYPH
jgi:NTE family protein